MTQAATETLSIGLRHPSSRKVPESDGRSGAAAQTPSTGLRHPSTAVFSYAIGSRKLSANEQVFFVGAQTLVCLLQTAQTISDVCFVSDDVAQVTPAQVKPKNHLNRDGTLFLPGVDAPPVYVRAWVLGCFYSHISTQTPSTGLQHPSFNHCRI